MTTAYVTPYWQFKFNQDVQTINEYVFDNGRENRDYIVLFRCSDSSFEMKCKKIKLNTKHPSLFTFCLVVLLLFILILFEIHKQQVNETNKLTGKFVDTWWKLTPWIKQFLFKSEIITKRAIYLIWKIFFKAKIKYLYSFILQNVPFCL